jgi:hypothetical protein
MRWAGRKVSVGERRCAYRILVENLKERDHLENPYIDRTIIQVVWGDGPD